MKNLNYFYVNNIKVNNIDKNRNIIDYLENLNIKVPHFCYHQSLSVAGNCRMCLVELKNSPKPLISCAMTVTNKMEIFTDSPLVKKARENVLEFLLLNHPLDCPICDQGGECDLQDQSMVFGTSKKRFYQYKRSVSNKNLGSIVKTVMTRCIHCTRCVRFANEIAGVEDLGVFGRGTTMEIGTYVNKVFQSELSGNVIDICPVGALTSKPYSFVDRTWELKNVKSIDFNDGFSTNLQIFIKNNKVITKILPCYNNNDLVNDWISDKTRFSFDGMFSPERIPNVMLSNEKNIKISTWNYIFEEIIYILYFQDHLNKHFFKTPKITLVFSSTLNLENLSTLLLLEKKFSFLQLKKINSSTRNSDHKFNFILNTATDNLKLNSSNLCLLIGINTRYDGPALNMKLRQRYLKGNFKIFSLNSSIDLTFPVKTIGSNLNILKSIVEGNHYLCPELLHSKNPLIICSSEIFKRKDSLEISEFLNSLKSYIKIFHKNWNGFNILNSTINEAGINNLGVFKSFNEFDFTTSTGFYFIDTNLSNEFIYKFIELKLLKYINFEQIENNFVIEQGNFLSKLINKKNNFNSYINFNLPNTVFFENSGTYYTTEGIFKKTFKVVSPFKQSKSNWQILRKLIFYTKKINFLTTFNSNNKIIFNYKVNSNFIKFINFQYFPLTNYNSTILPTNTLKNNIFFKNSDFKLLNKKIFNNKPILWIEDFYIGGKDIYSKFSKVMIECSKSLRLEKTNFKYLI